MFWLFLLCLLALATGTGYTFGRTAGRKAVADEAVKLGYFTVDRQIYTVTKRHSI